MAKSYRANSDKVSHSRRRTGGPQKRDIIWFGHGAHQPFLDVSWFRNVCTGWVRKNAAKKVEFKFQCFYHNLLPFQPASAPQFPLPNKTASHTHCPFIPSEQTILKNICSYFFGQFRDFPLCVVEFVCRPLISASLPSFIQLRVLT